jgi:hypothetical protein
MGRAAQQVVLENRGALERTVDVITRVLNVRTLTVNPQSESFPMKRLAEKP